jgi:hypothetical protein
MQYHWLRRLDDRVRNGNGYDPTDIATSKARSDGFPPLWVYLASEREVRFVEQTSLVIMLTSVIEPELTVVDKNGQANRPLVLVT